MAEHVEGPLYYERMGREGPPMVFVHPNPMDQSSWLFQLAHLSTWYRCLAVDLPGYGRSPHARDGLTMANIAQACWEAVDDARLAGPAVLVGCSVGASLVLHMRRLRPERTAALVLSGTGFGPVTDFTGPHIRAYQEQGVSHRWQYTFDDFSPAFRSSPLARYFAELFRERDDRADVDTIIRQFRALEQEAPADLHDVGCPTIILTGSEDGAHKRSFLLKDRIAGCELSVLPGAGHACHLEQPWLFDRLLLEFLDRHGLGPGRLPPVR